MTAEPLILAALLAWGTLAGVDLVSVPQAMLGRPLVAATVAGLVAGDLDAGLRVGMLLECFALDILPIGAARYPDFGPAAVVGTAATTLVPWPHGLGAAVLLGLVVALGAGRGMEFQRRGNGRLVRRAEPALRAGDPRAVARLQWQGIALDTTRSLLATGLGLGLVAIVMPFLAGRGDIGPSLTLVAVAGALVAAFSGVARRAGAGAPRAAVAAGLAGGGVLAWLA